MKKIVLVVGSPGFNINNPNSAVALYLLQLVQYLESHGYTVMMPFRREFSQVSVRRGGSGRNTKDFLRMVLPGVVAYLQSFQYRRQQRQLIKEYMALPGLSDADIILEFPVYQSTIGAALKRETGKQLVVIFDSPLVEQYQEFNKNGHSKVRVFNAERETVRCADLIIVYSKAVENWIVNAYSTSAGFCQMPCILWKGNVEKKEHTDINIGFVGSFLPWHRVDLLVQAFERLAAEGQNVRLCLIGQGMMWEDVKSKVDQSPFRDRINMPGFVLEDTLTEIKQVLDIGVMPGSNWYGSPLKLFEFAESGIAVVSVSTPTICEYFIDGENALLFNPSDTDEPLYQQLKKLVDDMELRKKLADRGLKMMNETLHKRKVFGEFCNFLQQVTR